jgi:spermidine/putrescine transport system ATP-binding protein
VTLLDTNTSAPEGHAVHVARVDSVLFDGANSVVIVRESVTAQEFRIALPQNGSFADLKRGDDVRFAFDPARTVCFRATHD